MCKWPLCPSISYGSKEDGSTSILLAWHSFSQIFPSLGSTSLCWPPSTKPAKATPSRYKFFSVFIIRGPSNINIIVVMIKDIGKKYFFYMRVLGSTGEKNCIFFVIRDKTFKHKYDYFHINQRCLGKKITWAYQGGPAAGKISIFFIIRPSYINIIFIKEIQTKLILTGAKIIQ